MPQSLKFIFAIKLYMFRIVPVSIVLCLEMYTQQYILVMLTVCSQAVSKHVWHVSLLCEWKIPDDGQRNCPKHVEFYSKNRFKKIVHLVGFIVTTPTSFMLFGPISGRYATKKTHNIGSRPPGTNHLKPQRREGQCCAFICRMPPWGGLPYDCTLLYSCSNKHCTPP